MDLFELAGKIKLWKKLHPEYENSCHLCPMNDFEEGFTGSICNDLIAIFKKRYNMPTTTKIYGICPIPFMDREDFK